MPLLLLTTAWTAGLLAASPAPLLAVQWLILAGIGLLALLLSIESRYSRWVFGLILMFCLGAARGQQAANQTDLSQLAGYNDLPQQIQLTGTIIDYPEERENHSQFTIEIDEIKVGAGTASPIEGKAMARASRFGSWQYGDRVVLNGRLETPPVFEDFSYKAYLARSGIHSLLRVEYGYRQETGQGNPLLRGIYRIRSRAQTTIGRLFPQPEASLLSGILLGLEGGISPSTRTTFDRTGTTHIIAISGFNITIIAGLFVGFGKRWLGALRGSVIAGLAIGLYTILVGADAAVLRASLMAGLALIAQRLGRQTDGLAALAASAFLMTAIDPAILSDIGFQLSFAATLGLLLYSQPMTEAILSILNQRFHVSRASLDRIAGPFSEYFMVTLAAQVTTLPLILIHFNRLSLISPLANLMILPAQPAVMVLAGAATVFGLLWLPLGRMVAALALPFASYTIEMVEWLAAWPMASLLTAPIPIVGIIAFYLLLLTITLSPRIRAALSTDQPAVQVPWLPLVLILLIANSLSWRLVFEQPDGRTHLTLLETGGQPGILIETAEGRRLLIDGGASSISLGSQLDARMSPLRRQLDWIILTDPNEESAAGIAGLMERYQIGGALVVTPSADATYRRIAAALEEIERPVGPILDGQTMDLGAGASLKLNLLANGAAYQIRHGRANYLLVLGRPADWTESLESDAASPSALLLPGSGDAELTPPDQLVEINPQVVLIAVEPGQGRGLPARAITERFEGQTLLRTDQNGWVELITDGERLWVKVERGSAQAPQGLMELDLFPWRSTFLSLD